MAEAKGLNATAAEPAAMIERPRLSLYAVGALASAEVGRSEETERAGLGDLARERAKQQ